MNKDIEEIKREILPLLLKQCSCDDDKNSIICIYEDYLINEYEAILNLARMESEGDDFSSFKATIINEEKKLWKDCPVQEIKAKIINTRIIDDIVMISNDVFSMAKKVKKSGQLLMDDTEYSRLESTFKTLYEKLSNELKCEVAEMYSESLLDLDFAFGKSNNQSMRLGRESFVEMDFCGGQRLFDSIQIKKQD